MSAPITVQKLKHGKALCGKTFGQFVETFNWLVDFCLSLKGDRDSNPCGDGRVQVDRSDPSAPVIRLASVADSGEAPDDEEEIEPGADPYEPYSDPEDTFDDDPEAINGDGNAISFDGGFISNHIYGPGEEEEGDFCNSIFGLAGDNPFGGNEISYTCSK